MKAVIQRVSRAEVQTEGRILGKIGQGYMILLGVHIDDNETELDWLIKKIIQLRLFNDEDGKMNLDIMDVDGEILVVSQFTLHAKYKKGNRPSYIKAARPELAIPLYERFVSNLTVALGKPVQTGEFGAMMDVSLTNDGPVTIIIDTKNKE